MLVMTNSKKEGVKMAKSRRRLYIAYGSNMNLEQMKFRCPTAKVVGTALLRNWRLIFRNVASIEPCLGKAVPVVVWEIQPQDEKALDRYEGYPSLYRKESVRITLNGKQHRVMVYIMNGTGESPPSLGYFNSILEGYKSAGIDDTVLRIALESSKGRSMRNIRRGGKRHD
jgi:gamma-glutamylcyclotransferase (GGCT)/AIG2-like uncharacterized protein YtfP